MRTSAWTNDISDPSQITSYFAYWPNIHSLHSDCRTSASTSCSRRASRRPIRRRAPSSTRRSRQRYNEAAPIVYLYETPYPVAFRKNAKGFVQIPLGNNLFEAAYVEK